MPDYLQAIRDCCRDEAAFERLKQILASAVRDEAFELLLGYLDSNFSTNTSPLPDIICQFPKQNCLESDSLKAITRISGYEENVIGSNSINIAERKRVHMNKSPNYNSQNSAEDDLLPEYNFDYRQARPNRFAAERVNLT